MSAPRAASMNAFERKIATMIGAIFRHWHRRLLQWSAALAGVVLLVWGLSMIVLDNLLLLSSGQLLVGWGVLAMAALGCGVLFVLRLSVTRPPATRLALMYETRVPGQHNHLINAVHFMAARKLRQDPLVQAALAESATTLRLDTAAQAVDARPLRRMLIVLAVVAMLALLYTASRPRWVANGFARLLQPTNPATHLLATEPTVRPGDIETVAGDPLTITAEVQPSLNGHRPDDVYLEYRTSGLEWVRVSMTPDEGAFRHEFAAVWHPLEYRVQAGRCISPTYNVRVRPRPRLSTLQVTVREPRYAGGRERTLQTDVGDISALAGSTVSLRLEASVSLAEALIEFSDGRTVPLHIVRDEVDRDRLARPAGDHRRAEGRFVLDRSGSYAIRLTDHQGLTNANPPRYTLTAEPDQAPLVVVTRPGRDLILPANARLTVQIEVEDDLAPAQVVLQTRRGEQNWEDMREFDFPTGTMRRQVVETSLDLADLGLVPGDVLLYRATARDRREPEPNVGVSRTWSAGVAEAGENEAALAAQIRRLLEALRHILELQCENRRDFDLDRAIEPIRQRQERIHALTLTAIDNERRALRPNEVALAELAALADGPMLQTSRQLADFGGPYTARFRLKPPILALMDEIIDRLEALIGQVSRSLAKADQAQQALTQLPQQERDEALARIRDLLEKLREFVPQQDEVIRDTEELARRAENLTDEDLQKIEQLRGTEDEWAEIFTASVRDIEKLTEQGFADRSIANDYKEMVEQIEEASKNLTPDLIQLAVPREQAGRELAESLVEEMEMWLPSSPDHIQWIMEEPLDFPEIPLVDLPDQLWDYIGDLIEDQDELNDAAEDVTSAWADSLAEGAGWEVAGGPISNFSAVGKTGNQLPDNNELSGRSGEGRSGRSQGQLVEDVAKGLQGRKTPTRVTNDAYEQGVVKELQQMATGGATGGGKARGVGQEGLQGQSPPPLYEGLQRMRDWQRRIRQKAQRTAGQLQMVRINTAGLEESIALMKEAELAADEGRYGDMFRIQQMVLQTLRMSGDLATREMILRVQRAYHLPAEQRRQMLDAMDEPVPAEYQEAVRRYFLRLSEAE